MAPIKRPAIQYEAAELGEILHHKTIMPFNFCQLPAEVLADVLSFVQVASEDTPEWRSFETRWMKYDRGWTECTLICKFVREVALATPSLWALIVHTSDSAKEIRWAEICALRAKGLGLKIAVRYDRDLPYTPQFPLPDVFWQRAHGVDVGHIGVDPYRYIPLLHSSHPCLAELSFATYTSIGADFLGGMSATLTFLHLNGGQLEKAPHLPALRHLTYVCNLPEIGPKCISELVVMLAGASLLETLALVLPAPSHEVVASEYQKVSVVLPKLRRLQLCAFPTIMSPFIRALPTPSAALSVTAPIMSVEVLDGAVYAYIYRFWRQAAGEASIPNARVECHRGATMFRIGTYFWGYPAASSPCIFFETPFMTAERIPPAHTVDTLQLDENCSTLDLAKLGNIREQIRHIIVYRAQDVQSLPIGFEEWVTERATAQQPLDTAKFAGCGQKDTQLRELVRKWETENMIRDVIWEIW